MIQVQYLLYGVYCDLRNDSLGSFRLEGFSSKWGVVMSRLSLFVITKSTRLFLRDSVPTTFESNNSPNSSTSTSGELL